MVIDFLNKKGWNYKNAGKELLLEYCPYCQKKNHFYINKDSGFFDCKKCQESGGLVKLKKDFDTGFIGTYKKPSINYIEENKINIPSKNWLNETRKISLEVIAKANIKFEPYKVGFIYRDENNKPYAVKWRNTNSKEFYLEPKTEIYYPYLFEQINYDKEYIIICEGEVDCLTYKTYGYDNCVGIPGAGSFKGQWIDIFKRFKTIYLSLDNDEHGEKGTKKIVEKLKDDCELKIIKLKHKDINDCLCAGVTTADIKKCFDTAKAISNEDIIHVYDIKIKKATAEDFGFSSGFKNLDNLIQWRSSELTVFTATTKAGKTTLLTNFMLEQLKNNRPVLVGSFEMSLEAMKKKLFSIIMGQSYYTCDNIRTFEEFENQLKYLPLYFINHYGSITDDKLHAAIKYSVKHYDIKFILIDHMQYAIKPSQNNMVYEIGEFMRKIKTLTNQYNIHTWLIVHPTKTSSANEVDEYTLRGSSEIAQICDNLIVIRADKEKLITKIELKLSRSELSNIGSIELKFDKEKQTYFEIKPEIKIIGLPYKEN